MWRNWQHALVLGTSAFGRGGSTPLIPTKSNLLAYNVSTSDNMVLDGQVDRYAPMKRVAQFNSEEDYFERILR